MKVTRCIEIQAAADRVWQVLGPNFADADQWCSAVFSSEARHEGQPLPGAPAAGRVCETSIGPAKETVTRYDETAHRITYAAHAEKMPGFVRGLVGDWHVESLPGERSRVTFTMTADLKFPFSLVMPPLMKLQLKPLARQTLEELKHFVETGQPHPRKREAKAAPA